MRSQRVGHNWATDLIWSDLNITLFSLPFSACEYIYIKIIQQIIYNEIIFLCDPDIYRELIAYEF